MTKPLLDYPPPMAVKQEIWVKKELFMKKIAITTNFQMAHWLAFKLLWKLSMLLCTDMFGFFSS